MLAGYAMYEVTWSAVVLSLLEKDVVFGKRGSD